MISVEKTSPNPGRLFNKILLSMAPVKAKKSSMKLHPLVSRSQVLIGKVGVGSQQNECSRFIVILSGIIKHCQVGESLERKGHRGCNHDCLAPVYGKHTIPHSLQQSHDEHRKACHLPLYAPSAWSSTLLFNTSVSCTPLSVSIFKSQLECYFVREVTWPSALITFLLL